MKPMTCFPLYVAAAKKALEACTDNGSIAEFVVMAMEEQRAHPELDMIEVFGITLTTQPKV